MQIRRIGPGDPDLPRILTLLRDEFAYMRGRIDPQSSLNRMTLEVLTQSLRRSELWVIGAPPAACIILTPQVDSLYLGKLCVAQRCRGTGLARRLIALAEDRARAMGLPALALKTRVELHENQAIFQRMGFVETGRTAHPGFDRDTSIIYRKTVPDIP